MIRCILFLLAMPLALLAQNESAPVHLRHADRLVTERVGDQTITTLTGRVHFEQSGGEIFADQAVWAQSKQEITFYGHVTLSDSFQTVESDRIVYNQNTQVGASDGAFRYCGLTDNTELTGYRGTWDRERNLVVVDFRPVFSQIDASGQRIVITGKRLELWRDKHMAKALREARLEAYDRDDKLTLAVNADSLVFFDAPQSMEAFSHVVIRMDGDTATSQWARYVRDDSLLMMTQNPRLQQRRSYLEGDTIVMHLANDKLSRVDVWPEAHGIYISDKDSLQPNPDLNRLNSRAMTFYFTDGAVSGAALTGNAQVVYFPEEKDSLVTEQNDVRGDSIWVRVDSSRIDYVSVVGNARGVYSSERIRPGPSVVPDTLVPADTTRSAPPTGGAVARDTLYYDGAQVEYYKSEDRVVLTGNSRIRQKDMTLTAERIDYESRKDLLTAFGLPDSTDTLTGYKGAPNLKSAKDEINGIRMTYNPKTRVGRVAKGRTHFDKGWYTGDDVKKLDNDVFLVRDGTFSTCELRKPHYHFYAPRMKIETKKMAVVEPVIFYLGPVPLFVIPAWVFSLEPGRHSGLLPFSVGNFERGDRFIRNVGYYWAASDYWDMQGGFDYDQYAGLTLKTSANWGLRYILSGNFSARVLFSRRESIQQVTKGTEWMLSGSHSHQISPTLRLSASGQFISTPAYIYNISNEPEQILNQDINSHLSLVKSFSNTSVTLSLDRHQNLRSGNVSMNLPSLQFSLPSRQVIPQALGADNAWYNQFYWSYAFRGLNVENKADTSAPWTQNAAAQHDLSVSFTQPIKYYVTLSPSFRYKEVWQDRDRNGSKPARGGTWAAALSARTTLYGMFPGIGPVKTIRHTFTPSISYAYTPEVTGAERFYYVGGIGMGNIAKAQTISMNIDNAFAAKLRGEKKDTTINLFTASLSSAYNFENKTRPWSNINTSLRGSYGGIDLTVGLVHSPYSKDSNHLIPPRFISYRVDASTNFTGTLPFFAPIRVPAGLVDSAGAPPPSVVGRTYMISVAYSMSEDLDISYSQKIQTLRISGDWTITSNWKLTNSMYYDLDKGKITEHSYSIRRQLHCWEAIFNWVPEGIRSGWYFKIAIKDLPDIKLEHNEGNLPSGGGTFGGSLLGY